MHSNRFYIYTSVKTLRAMANALAKWKRSFILLNIAANLWHEKRSRNSSRVSNESRIGFPSCCCPTSAVFIYRLKSAIDEPRESTLLCRGKKAIELLRRYRTSIETRLQSSCGKKRTRSFVAESFFSGFHRVLSDVSRPEAGPNKVTLYVCP